MADQETEQAKLAEDFKKLYGVEYTPENIDKLTQEGKMVTLVGAEKALTSKKTLEGYSTTDLAKLQFAVRQAEFDLKYGQESTGATDQAIKDRRQNIVDNKDKMNDAILGRMEWFAYSGKTGAKDYNRHKAIKDSFNMLYENAPEELKKHCGKTLEQAHRKMNSHQGTSASRLEHAAAQKLKYKSMEIKDTDSLWTMAKKTAQMKGFNASRTAKKGIKRLWKRTWVSKAWQAEKAYWKAEYHGLRRVGNRIKLFPSRAKKAIGKFWKDKITGPLKKKWQEKVAGPIKKAWNKRVVEPFNKKIVEPFKKNVVEPVKRGVDKSVKWVKDNKKKVMAGAVMVASIGIGAAVAGPAGAVAGAKFGSMAVAGATAAYGTYKGAKWTYNKGVEIKNQMVSNAKENLKNSFQKNQEKIPNVQNNQDKEKVKAEMSYTAGRQVFNQQPETMKGLLDSYKKSINPEGNEGKPLTEKEAAIKMYQTMVADKNKGGMGLSQESAQSVMTYFKENNTIKSGFEDIKDEINKPISEKEPETKKSENTAEGTDSKTQSGQENSSQEQQSTQQQEAQQQSSEKKSVQELTGLDPERAQWVESQLNILNTLNKENGLKPDDEMYKGMVDMIEKGFDERGITAEQRKAIRESNPGLFPKEDQSANKNTKEQSGEKNKTENSSSEKAKTANKLYKQLQVARGVLDNKTSKNKKNNGQQKDRGNSDPLAQSIINYNQNANG